MTHRPSDRGVRAGLVSALALGLLLGALAGSASAAVTGRQGLSEPTPASSSNKSVTATCTGGRKLLGTGAYVSEAAANSQVHLSQLRPSSNLESVLVTAQEDENGFAGNWTLFGHRICADPILELERITATSAETSSNKTATASCPAGKKAVGGGGEVVDGNQQVVMDRMKPNSTLTGFVVRGAEDGTGFSGSWKVTAYAICAKPPAGLQLRTAATTANSDNKIAQATCSAGRLVGAGAEITGGGGQVAPDLLIQTSVSAQARGFEDENGYSGNWSITSYAVCAGISFLNVAQTSTDSTDAKSAQLGCLADTRVTGGGGDITGGLGQVALRGVQPMGDPPTGVSVAADEDDNSFGRAWSLRAYQICATPLPGLDAVSVPSSIGSPPTASAASECPSGKRLVGAGAMVGGGGGDVVLHGITPTGNPPTGVLVAASEDEDGTTLSWNVTSHAICADPPPGHELVSASTLPDSDPASTTAQCSPGKNVLGAAGSVNNGVGQVVLDDLRPTTFDVTVSGLEDESGFDSNWSVTAYAICASP